MCAPSSDAARIIPSLHEIAPWNGFITQMSIAPEFETSSVKRRLRVRPLNRIVTPTDPSFMVTGSSIPRPAFRPSMTAVRACCLNMAVFMSQGTLTAKRAKAFHFPVISGLVRDWLRYVIRRCRGYLAGQASTEAPNFRTGQGPIATMFRVDPCRVDDVYPG